MHITKMETRSSMSYVTAITELVSDSEQFPISQCLDLTSNCSLRLVVKAALFSL